MEQVKSNELTPAIAGMYWGASIDINGVEHKMSGLRHDVIGVFREKDSYGTWSEFRQCKLILKPLSEISDEDAIEVTKMAIGHHPCTHEPTITKMGGRTSVVLCKGLMPSTCHISPPTIHDSHGREHMYVYNTNDEGVYGASVFNMPGILNYLRSKSYDIDGLLESGIAITKPAEHGK